MKAACCPITSPLLTRSLRIASALLLSLGVLSSSLRADQNWDGDNAIGNFSFNNNWYGDSQPGWGFGNGSLFFNLRNGGSTSAYYDYGAWVNTNDIIWDTTFNGATSLDGNGQGINFNQRLENRSSFTQTLGATMNLSGAKNGATQIELNPVKGDLIINGTIYNENSKPYYVYGTNGKTLTVNSTLGVGTTAANVSFNVAQNSSVILAADQTYGGATVISAGSLTVGAGGTTGTLGSGAVTDNASLIFNRSNAMVVGNSISGTGSVTISGAGQTVFTGTNTYSGTTTISAGILEIGASSTTGSLGSGNVINNADLRFNRSNAMTVANAISGTGTVYKASSGTTTLSGNNGYSGTTTISQGTLEVTANNALGTTAGITSVVSGATLQLTNVNYSTAEPVSINGTGFSGAGALRNSGISSFAGPITVNTNATINAGGGTLSLTGGIAKNGTILTIAGGGTVNVNTVGISGASANSDIIVDGTTVVLNIANTYNGPTTVQNSGILKLGISNAMPTAPHSALTLSAPATFDMNGKSDAIASLNGGGSVTSTLAGTSTLTVGGSNGSGTFSGVISNGTGTLALTKTGTGTQTLTGANANTGTTTINGGTLQIGDGGTTGTLGTGSVTNTGNLTFNRSDTITVANAIGGTAGTLTQLGTGTTILTGANGYTGITTISAGTLQVGNAGPTGTLGTGAIVNNASLVINRSNAITMSNAMSGSGNVTKQGSNTLTLSGATWTQTGTTTVSAGTLALTNSSLTGGTVNNSSTGTISVGTLNTIGGTLLNAAGGQIQISQAGTLYLQTGGSYTNNGTIGLNSNNNYSQILLVNGDVTIGGSGTMNMGSLIGNQMGAPASTNYRFTNGVGHTIQGNGNIGLNTMPITNDGTFLGVSGMTLVIDPNASGAVNSVTGVMRAPIGSSITFKDGPLGNSGLIEAIGGTINFSAASVNNSGGTVQTVGAGVMTLSTTTISGGTIANSSTGTINVGSSNTIGGTLVNAAGGQIQVSPNGTLNLQTGGSYTNNGTIGLNSNNNYSQILLVNGDVTIGGSGTITMGSLSGNLMGAPASTNYRFTNGVGHTIQGNGNIGLNTMPLTNNGTFLGVSGMTLVIDPNASGAINSATGVMRAPTGSSVTLQDGPIANSGVIEATGGTINFSGASVDNSGGTVQTVGSGVITLSTTTINGGTITNSSQGTITVGTSNTIGGTLVNAAGGLIQVSQNGTLNLQTGGSYTNNGTIGLNSNNNHSQILLANGDVTIGGSGTITMGSLSGNQMGAPVSTNYRFTNGVGHTIQGNGNIGLNTMPLTNNGTFLGVSGMTLVIDPNASGAINSATGVMRAPTGSSVTFQDGPITNSGVIEATGGAFNLNTAPTTNTGGIVRASSGSMNLTSSNITGGSVELSGTGSLNLNTTTISSGTLSNSGTGSINASAGNGTISSPITLTNSNSFTAASTRSLTLSGGIAKDGNTTTFSGAGTINVGTAGISGASSNSNIVTSATALNFTTPNTYGGSTTLSGGTLTVSGAGSLPDSTAVNFTTSATLNLSGITASGETIGSLAGTAGSVVLGAKNLTTGGDDTSTSFAGIISGTGGSLTKQGLGTTILTGANTYTGITTISAGTVQIGNAGTTGTLGTGAIVNNASLVINRSNDLAISNAMSGTGGVTKLGTNNLTLLNADWRQTGTTTISTGTVTMTTSTIAGGTVNFNAGTTVTVTDLNTGSSLAGAVTIAAGAQINVLNSSSLAIFSSGSYTNNGSIGLRSGGNYAQLYIVSNATINGTGTLTMENTAGTNNWIFGPVGSVLFTNGPGHTIQGSGQIGRNAISFRNEGIIQANNILGTGGITLDPGSSGATNAVTGIIRATNTAQLAINDATISNLGMIEAASGEVVFSSATVTGTGSVRTTGNGRISLNSSSITGGTIENSSTGTISVPFTTTGNPSTISGTLTNAAGGVISIAAAGSNAPNTEAELAFQGGGTYTNNGSMTLSGNYQFAVIRAVGNVTLGGSGTLTMIETTQGGRAVIDGSGTTSAFTNGVGHTIQGEGNIGYNNLIVGNDGNIIANTSGRTLIVDPSSGGAINGTTGVFRATTGSTLTFQGGPLTNLGVAETIGGTFNLNTAPTNNAGGIVRASAGSTNVNSSNITGGAVNLSGTGVLNINSSTISGGTLSNSGTGSINASTGNGTVSSPITLTNSNSLTAASTRTLNLSGGITKDGNTTTFSGAGTINVSGTGIIGASSNSNIVTSATALNFTAANTYGGSTTVNGGTLTVSGAGTLPDTTAVNITAGTLNLSGITASSETIGSLAGTAGSVVLGAKNLTTGGDDTSTTFAGVISGALAGVTKVGAGTMTLSDANTYTGPTTISAGTVSVATVGNGGVAGGLGQATNAAANLVFDGGTLQYTGASASTNRAFTINAGKVATFDITTNNLTLAGASAVTTGGLTKTGAGTLTLGIAQGHSGTTVVNAGTLAYGLNNALSTGGLTVDGASAIVNLGTFSDTVGQVIVDNGGSITGTGTLTSTAGFDVRSGTISAPISGAVGVTKNTAGTVLATVGTSYTGATSITNGTLEVTANNALGTTATGTTVSNGGALKLTGVNYSTAEVLTINGSGVSGGGALANSGTSSFAGQITAATNASIHAGSGTLNLTGGLVKNGTTLTLTGGGTVNVNSVISGSAANSDLVVDATTANLNSANTYNGPTIIRNGGVINATVSGALPASPRSAITLDDSGSGGSALNLTTSNTMASLSGAATSIVSVSSGNTLSIGTSSGSSTFGGSISGAGAMIKDGASTQTLSGPSTYSGGSTVSAGKLNVTNTSGSATGSGAITVDSSASLTGTGRVIAGADNLITINGALVVGDSTLGTPIASELTLGTSGSGSTVLGSSSTLLLDLFTAGGDKTGNTTAADRIRLFGVLDPSSGGTLVIGNPNGLSVAYGDQWRLFDLTSGSIASSLALDYSALTLSGGQSANFDTITGILSIVPEPGRASLLILGGFGLLARRRRSVE